jgi:imidazolonepropionase-like amidohydrolase
VFVVLAAILTMPLSARAWESLRPSAGSTVTLLGGQVVRPDGSLGENLAVVVRDGKIRRLVPAASVRDQNARRFDSAVVICPGLIDVFSQVGTSGQSLDTEPFVDPDANVLDAMDPSDEDFAKALRCGITAAMVAPSPHNLVAGTAATVRTYGPDGQLDVLCDQGPLLFAFGDEILQQDRPPTSRAGALYELRNLVEQARAGSAHPLVNAALAGQMDALVVCPRAVDVATIRDAFGDAAARFGVVHTGDAIDMAAGLGGHERPVVVGPYTFASSRRVLLGAAALSKAGVEVAFSGRFPEFSADSLRITAALAVRHGMDPAAARRAITIAPARTAGVADRIGSIAPGKDGDLVVFSRDPLRPDAAVLEVYIKGVRVYAAANQDLSAAGTRP